MCLTSFIDEFDAWVVANTDFDEIMPETEVLFDPETLGEPDPATFCEYCGMPLDPEDKGRCPYCYCEDCDYRPNLP